MPIYNYVALNEKGRTIKGGMTAANELDLEERLKVIGLDVIDAKITKTGKKVTFGKVNSQDLIIFCIHMEQLERAGVPLLDSIADLRDTSDNLYFKNIIAEIYESVSGGDMLSAALAKHPKIFDNIFVSLVQAGEKSGNLNEVFQHLVHHYKWTSSIQRKIKKAIYYPLFLLFLMSGIIALMMLFVIPKLSNFLKAQNFDLPGYTQALISTSEFFVESWYILFIAPFLIFIVFKILMKLSDNFAYNIDNIKLHIPYISGTIRKVDLARFCHFFGIMYKSGLGILECIESANNIVSNKVLRESISIVRKSVSEGNSLTESLRVSNQFPNLVIRMFKVGEESGNLDVTLENVNFFYDREVEDAVSGMVGVIQPALTLIMGGVMMWVSMAIFGPLYNSFSKMNF